MTKFNKQFKVDAVQYYHNHSNTEKDKKGSIFIVNENRAFLLTGNSLIL